MITVLEPRKPGQETVWNYGRWRLAMTQDAPHTHRENITQLSRHMETGEAFPLMERTLNSYLTDIDRPAQERLLLLTKQIAEQENVTKQLKADNAMLWMQKMNEMQSRVREIIYNEIIYT